MQNTIAYQVGGSVLELPPQAVQEIQAFVDYIQFKYHSKKQPVKPSAPKQANGKTPIQSLKGVLSHLPKDFDYKEFLSEELLADYLKSKP